MSDNAHQTFGLDRNVTPQDAANQIVEYAARLGASDIYALTNANECRFAVRHLGLPVPIVAVPIELGRRIVSHVKAVAGMDIAERNHPQDGRWIVSRADGKALDLRINTLPTLHGEDMTMRLLDRESRLLALDQLGLVPREHNLLVSMLANASGLILVTGPTGAGKTTTLYSCLRHLNDGSRKINTIEDPVEYQIDGLRQSPVREKANVGFAELLKSVLRQAPDVIMIGEIRDPETAATAVRAANSGHLVLSTLHAPIASAAVQSMLHLGVHPHFLASSLLGVVTQRLIRTLCPKCRVLFTATDGPDVFGDVRSLFAPGEGYRYYGPRGCADCRNTGYVSRTGVFEVLKVTPAIRQLIVDRAPTQAIQQKARDEGLVECRRSAILKVASGATSFDEIIRTIPEEYLENAGAI
ncbi:MAG: GspE/PulE family protein [Gemmataceae bacterium]